MNDLISVIIPIYNVEKYLKKCIESVIKQTYTNLEIILVNDGSTDGSGQICNEYKEKDNRIKVIHKENGGISDARNIGLNIATGKFIYFVDSDDYINDDAIEYLYKLLINNDAAIVIGNDKFVYEKTINKSIELQEENKNNKEWEEIKTYTPEEAIKSTFYNYGLTSSIWNKLYRAELFVDIRYPSGKICEDLATTYKLFARSNKIIFSNKITYNYLANRATSYMNVKFKKERMDGIYFCKEIINNFENEYPKLKDAAIYRLIIECIFVLMKLPNKREYKEENKEVKYCLKKYRFSVIKDKNITRVSRILLLVSYLGRIPLRIAWKIKEMIKEIIRK